MSQSYRAIVSSDWSECLSPTGPFDPISFNYPELASELSAVFQDYTGSIIPLGEASQRIRKLLPGLLSIDQMDAYLDQSFVTYKGVPEVIEWCSSNDILFMINTTGMMGFFQRVFAKGLLPPVPALSGHPMILYPTLETDPHYLYELLHLQDKAVNTEAIVQELGVPPNKVFIIGDSGGDGPHFKWGSGHRAFLIGSMTKPSLKMYCRDNGITINLQFGLSYNQGEERNPVKEMSVDFMDLASVIEEALE